MSAVAVGCHRSNDANCVAADTNLRSIAFPQYYSNSNTGLDPYGVDYSYCTAAELQREQQYYAAHAHEWLTVDTQAQRDTAAVAQTSGVDGSSSQHFGACQSNFVTIYLNRSDVLAAIHVSRSNTNAYDNHEWAACSSQIAVGNAYDYASSSNATEVDYQRMFDHSINVVIVSGDDDTVCGLAGTQ